MCILASIFQICFLNNWKHQLRSKGVIIQKQRPEVFCEQNCPWKFLNIHRKILVSESRFNKVARKVCNFIKKRLQHMCFHVNIVKFLRASILKNISERLLKHLILRRSVKSSSNIFLFFTKQTVCLFLFGKRKVHFNVFLNLKMDKSLI